MSIMDQTNCERLDRQGSRLGFAGKYPGFSGACAGACRKTMRSWIGRALGRTSLLRSATERSRMGHSYDCRGFLIRVGLCEYLGYLRRMPSRRPDAPPSSLLDHTTTTNLPQHQVGHTHIAFGLFIHLYLSPLYKYTTSSCDCLFPRHPSIDECCAGLHNTAHCSRNVSVARHQLP